MDELTDQIRAWTDRAALGDDGRITLDEIRLDPAAHHAPPPAPRRSHRRGVVLAAAALAVVVAIGAAVLVTRPTGTVRTAATTTPGPTTTTAPEAEVEVRDLAEGSPDAAELANPVATTQAGYDFLWEQAGLDVPQPAVDFDREVVVAVTSGGCGTVTGLHRSGDLLTPTWDLREACLAMYRPTVEFVAVDASATGDRFRYEAQAWDGVGPEPDGWTITVERPTRREPEPPSTVPATTTIPPMTKAERAERCPDIDTWPASDMAVLAAGTILIPKLPEGFHPTGEPVRSTIPGTEPGTASTIQTQTLTGPDGRTIRVITDLGGPGGLGNGKALAATVDLEGKPVVVQRCDEPAGQRITVAERDDQVTATLVVDGTLRWAIVGDHDASPAEVVAVAEALDASRPDPWPRDGAGG